MARIITSGNGEKIKILWVKSDGSSGFSRGAMPPPEKFFLNFALENTRFNTSWVENVQGTVY